MSGIYQLGKDAEWLVRCDLDKTHPGDIVSIAIPTGFGEIKVMRRNIVGSPLIISKGYGFEVPLLLTPGKEHVIIESIQITENGLVIVGNSGVGVKLSERCVGIIERMIKMMKAKGMRDFYCALPDEYIRKTKFLVFSLGNNGRLNYKHTLIGISNMRAVHDVAIHTCFKDAGYEAERCEIRVVSLADIANGVYLSRSVMNGGLRGIKGVTFIGRPNLVTKRPCVPLTFSDGTSKILDIGYLLSGARGSKLFVCPRKTPAIIFPNSARVIGEISDGLHGAVYKERLVIRFSFSK